MTVVIAIQVLAAGLLGGVLFGRRSHCPDHMRTVLSDVESAAIEFHPELLIHWDNDASYLQPSRCDGRTSADRRVRMHTQATTFRPHMRIR